MRITQIVVSMLVGASLLLAGNGSPVPEPGTWGLIAGGFAALLILNRRRRNKK